MMIVKCDPNQNCSVRFSNSYRHLLDGIVDQTSL